MTISHGASENPLGEAAYTAYGRVTNFKNFQGDPMPAFDDLPERIRNAWINAARSIWELATTGQAGEDWATNALGDILGQITELSEKVDKLEMLVTKVLDEIVPHIDSVAKGPIGKMLGLGK